jgi:hypothetical protein
MNHYEMLEVSPNASEAVLKAAYKSLMQRYHPDRNPGDAEAAKHSLSVIQAYEVLSDPGKRAAYDIELKRQLADLDDIRNRTRFSPAPVVRSDTESAPHWYLWLVFGSILLVIWFIFPPFEKVKISDSELKEIGSVLGAYQSQLQPDRDAESPADTAARTIPVYIEELNVNLLETRAESAETPMAGLPHVLTIHTLGIVVGASDAEEFISFLDNNKEFIIQRLAEKLASAQYEMLVKHNGDQYLKRLILDAIGEITGAHPLKELPSAGMEPPAYYGAVDVLLPDSFTVK